MDVIDHEVDSWTNKTVIVVHEMYGRTHNNYCQIYLHVGVCVYMYVCECVFFSLSISQAVWPEYKLSADEAGVKAAAYTTFCSLWCQLVPHITVMKPMSDLCWVCQKNSVAIMRAPETEKSQVTYNSVL